MTESTSPPDPLRLDRQVCFALSAAARSVVAVYRPVLEPMGLTHPQYLVMLALWERAPRSVGEISEALLLEPATLSPLLRRLESQGLVTRARSTTDERRVEIGLTAAGAALREQALSIPPRIVERLGMGLDELERLRDSLTRVIDAAGNAAAGTAARARAGADAEAADTRATGSAAERRDPSAPDA